MPLGSKNNQGISVDGSSFFFFFFFFVVACFVLFWFILVYFWRRQDTIQMTRRVVSDQGLTHARWIQPGYMVPETVVVHGLWCPKTVLKGSCTYPTLDGE